MSNCGLCDLYGPLRCPTHASTSDVMSWSRPAQHRCRVKRVSTPALLFPWVVACERCSFASARRTQRVAFKLAFAHASQVREVVL